jgi:protein SCO1/2
VRIPGAAVVGILLASLPRVSQAQVSVAASDDAPPVESRYLGRLLPDISLITTRGRSSLGTLSRSGPVMLTLVFTRCAGVCSPFLQSFRAADDSVGGRNAYRRLVLSFDPRDTAEDMARVASHLAVANRDDWIFGIASPEDVRRLSEAIGFWFSWNPSRQQYDHPAMLAALRQGRLVRVLVGNEITAARLSEVVRELNGEFVASYPLPSRARFRCFQYDAATGRTRLDWGFVLLLTPGVFTICATAGIFALGRRRRTR